MREQEEQRQRSVTGGGERVEDVDGFGTGAEMGVGAMVGTV